MSYWEGVTSRIKDNHTQLNVNVSTLKALISQVLVIKHHTPTAMSWLEDCLYEYPELLRGRREKN